MNSEKHNKVCSVEYAGGLDNRVRRWLHNPQKILRPYIRPAMTFLDLGCGPGVFTIEAAKMLMGSGKVIAADLQEGMLNLVWKKVVDTELEKRVQLHKCEKDSISLNEKVDFILAFYMIHEVLDQNRLFDEMKAILKPSGKIFIVEPKFHVTSKKFDLMLEKILSIGFEVDERPKVFFSRAVVLTNK